MYSVEFTTLLIVERFTIASPLAVHGERGKCHVTRIQNLGSALLVLIY
jgi:hypothetical protein